MSGKHLRQSPNGRRVRRAVTVSLVAAGLLGATAPAMAAKGGVASHSAGSCAVAPSSVPVGTDYAMTASGLDADSIVNVLVADAAGTTAWNLLVDAAGTTSVTGHAYWTGTSIVTVQQSRGRGYVTLASCSFSVV